MDCMVNSVRQRNKGLFGTAMSYMKKLLRAMRYGKTVLSYVPWRSYRCLVETTMKPTPSIFLKTTVK